MLRPALLPLLLAGVSGALPGLPLLQGRLVVLLLQGSLPVLVLMVRAGRSGAFSCSCNVVYMFR